MILYLCAQEAAEEEVAPDTCMDTNMDKGAETEKPRASRTMLTSTSTVPQALLDEFPIPNGCAISRTIHVDSCLPHFQGRLPAGMFHDGKILNSIVTFVSCLTFS